MVFSCVLLTLSSSATFRGNSLSLSVHTFDSSIVVVECFIYFFFQKVLSLATYPQRSCQGRSKVSQSAAAAAAAAFDFTHWTRRAVVLLHLCAITYNETAQIFRRLLFQLCSPFLKSTGEICSQLAGGALWPQSLLSLMISLFIQVTCGWSL